MKEKTSGSGNGKKQKDNRSSFASSANKDGSKRIINKPAPSSASGKNSGPKPNGKTNKKELPSGEAQSIRQDQKLRPVKSRIDQMTSDSSDDRMSDSSIKDKKNNKNKKPKKQKDLKPLAPPKEPVKPYVRKFRKFLLAAATIIVLLAICIVLSLTVFFKIDEIIVTGETRYDKSKIISASLINKGDNLLLCNTSDGTENIIRKFPYIENVEIKKQLFNKINIQITEAEPSSVVESDGKYIVLSKSGKIIEINDKNTYENIPLIMGAKLNNVKLCSDISYEDENLKKNLDSIIEMISKYSVRNVQVIDLTNTSSIMLIRKNGFKIRIGNFENIEYKIKTAASILSNNVRDDAKGTLDVSLASAEGGKSYLKIGEESSKVVQESKKNKEEPSKKSSDQESSTGETNNQNEAQDEGISGADETAEPSYDNDENTYDDGTGGEEIYDDGTGGEETYDDGAGGEETYDDGTDGEETYDDGQEYNYTDDTDEY